MRNSVRFIQYSLASIFLVSVAVAQTSAADTQYAQEQQYCATLSEPSRTACFKEAAAVRQEIRNGTRTSDNDSYRLNRVTRCDRLPVEDRASCLKLMSDKTQPKVDGSVQGGGVLRKMTIEIPAPPQQQAAPVQSHPAPSPATPMPLDSRR